MPQPTDIKTYASLLRPEDDASAAGGAIDTSCVLEVSRLTGNQTLEVVSGDAADVMNLTIDAREPSGVRSPEVLALNGLTVVPFVTTFRRFIKAKLAAAPAGDVTIRLSGGGATVVVFPAGKTDAAIMFIDSTSEATPVSRYEQLHVKNEAGDVSALLTAQVQLLADPAAAVLIGLDTAQNNNTQVADRKTAPAGVAFVDDGVLQAIPGGDLLDGSSIGVWVRQDRGANAPVLDNDFTLQVLGTNGI